MSTDVTVVKILATDKPITVVVVTEGAVYVVVFTVPIALVPTDLKVFAMYYPNAIDIAITESLTD
jgi:hypothetical protein